MTLQQLDVVFGIYPPSMLLQVFFLTYEPTGETIGSTAIDLEFEILANNRLEQANRQHPMGINVEDAAYTMMKSKEYLNAKVCLNSLRA